MISDLKRNNPSSIAMAFSTSEFPSVFILFITLELIYYKTKLFLQLTTIHLQYQLYLINSSINLVHLVLSKTVSYQANLLGFRPHLVIIMTKMHFDFLILEDADLAHLRLVLAKHCIKEGITAIAQVMG